jgi:polygalacturonase
VNMVASANPTLPTMPVIGSGSYPLEAAGLFNNNTNTFVDNAGLVNSATETLTNDTNNANAITSALGIVSNAGGGTMTIPTGTYFAQGMEFGSPQTVNNTDLVVDGTLESASMTNFANQGGQDDFIYWTNAQNDEISGTGVIDGQGSTWWPSGAPTSTYHALVQFSNASTIAIVGITAQNSPLEHFAFSGSHTVGVTINDVTINTPSTTSQTDGIDPNGQNFLIENTTITDGDDDIAIKAATGSTSVNNITITNVTFGYGHGLSVGGQTNLAVNNVFVNDVTFTNTQFGIRLKAGRSNGGIVHNLSYNNITMTGVQNPIFITSWYNGSGNAPPSRPNEATNTTYNTTTTPFWSNIYINNLTASGTSPYSGTSNAGYIYGLPEAPVQAVTLSNINISSTNGFTVNYAGYPNPLPAFPGSTAFSTSDIQFINSTINGVALTTESQVNNSSLFIQPSAGNFDSIVQISTVPEPATASLALMATAGLILHRRRSAKTE